MTSIELAKSIYEKAKLNNKKAWLSDAQTRYMINLMYKEGNYNEHSKSYFIAYILPNGEWIKDLTYGDAIQIGQENIKKVKIVKPPFYIRRQGFNTLQIIIENFV
jgi:hypothetical protein